MLNKCVLNYKKEYKSTFGERLQKTRSLFFTQTKVVQSIVAIKKYNAEEFIICKLSQQENFTTILIKSINHLSTNILLSLGQQTPTLIKKKIPLMKIHLSEKNEKLKLTSQGNENVGLFTDIVYCNWSLKITRPICPRMTFHYIIHRYSIYKTPKQMCLQV